ncbi:hypothetical protein MNBD_ALPHA02-1508 [hydrothermal vent metagenome]|uniref:Twin-arginine translocation protein TatB n=1 Tax=hydrothermal vent metagenome TaxID=652676 RepID=A0A3B0S0Y4_9ZZZZ
MFDIGMIEMFVIVVLAIIVVGPRDLPGLLRSIGRFVAKIRAMGNEFQTSIKQMADEVELEEVTRKLNEAGNIPLDDDDVTPDIKPEAKDDGPKDSS